MTIATVVMDVTLQPESLLVWLIVGVIAGFLASRVMRGAYSLLGDLIIGLVGAVIGGFLADLLGLGATNLLGSIILAFIGACLLIAVLRAGAGTRVRSRGRRRR
jgi:uncharacterized membrane protein YeaQ/YmgE (transglycosylase-associated protein family)